MVAPAVAEDAVVSGRQAISRHMPLIVIINVVRCLP
jgi:hypothetical protein